ncbi:Tol-Pal system protein TolQ [Methylocella tundrae]|uniref:Tol-Pal system protein TolQ n=2 Tax=Methylocella tundrae TaxID=227605 RepID=A0A8B6MBG5_METTU|nr:Tol-Pal system protein TolQ [Methylocella tundrae]
MASRGIGFAEHWAFAQRKAIAFHSNSPADEDDEMNPADIAATGVAATGFAPGSEVSLLSMFLSAHIVVKLVMLGLLGASVWCWAIIINKAILLRRTQRAMAQFEEVFWSGASLDELYATLSSRPTTGTASLFVAAMREWRRSVQGGVSSFMGLQARIEKVLDVSISREVEKLESNLLVLATVASASPFIGLFGTVWGIMTSFRSIAASRNTSLAVVAPGIAEALFATAIGLFAAIPALIAYNKLQGDVAKKQAQLEGFADEFSSILSRQIDQRTAHDQAA